MFEFVILSFGGAAVGAAIVGVVAAAQYRAESKRSVKMLRFSRMLDDFGSLSVALYDLDMETEAVLAAIETKVVIPPRTLRNLQEFGRVMAVATYNLGDADTDIIFKFIAHYQAMQKASGTPEWQAWWDENEAGYHASYQAARARIEEVLRVSDPEPEKG